MDQNKFILFFTGSITGFLLCYFTFNKEKQIEYLHSSTLINKLKLYENPCNYDQNGPRIMCTILAGSDRSEIELINAVKNTWAKRCNKFLFIKGNSNLNEQQQINKNLNENFLFLNLTEESRSKLSEKTIKTFLFIYENYLNEFDWLVKADLDTYIIMENLKYFLINKCPDDMHTYGRLFKKFHKYGYLDGGSGYVISREAIRVFGDKMKESENKFCISQHGIEDVEIAGCLAQLNIYPGNSRDEKNRERFHFTNLSTIWNYNEPWVYDYSYEIKHGRECCSDSSIGFHRVKGDHMYQFDYMIYNLKPHYFNLRLNKTY